MPSLSRDYVAAANDVEGRAYTAAGQAMLASSMERDPASWRVTCSPHRRALVGVGMLRARAFQRVAAFSAIVRNGLGLGLLMTVVGVPAANRCGRDLGRVVRARRLEAARDRPTRSQQTAEIGLA